MNEKDLAQIEIPTLVVAKMIKEDNDGDEPIKANAVDEVDMDGIIKANIVGLLPDGNVQEDGNKRQEAHIGGE